MQRGKTVSKRGRAVEGIGRQNKSSGDKLRIGPQGRGDNTVEYLEIVSPDWGAAAAVALISAAAALFSKDKATQNGYGHFCTMHYRKLLQT